MIVWDTDTATAYQQIIQISKTKEKESLGHNQYKNPNLATLFKGT